MYPSWKTWKRTPHSRHRVTVGSTMGAASSNGYPRSCTRVMRCRRSRSPSPSTCCPYHRRSPGSPSLLSGRRSSSPRSSLSSLRGAGRGSRAQLASSDSAGGPEPSCTSRERGSAPLHAGSGGRPARRIAGRKRVLGCLVHEIDHDRDRPGRGPFPFVAWSPLRASTQGSVPPVPVALISSLAALLHRGCSATHMVPRPAVATPAAPGAPAA